MNGKYNKYNFQFPFASKRERKKKSTIVFMTLQKKRENERLILWTHSVTHLPVIFK